MSSINQRIQRKNPHQTNKQNKHKQQTDTIKQSRAWKQQPLSTEENEARKRQLPLVNCNRHQSSTSTNRMKKRCNRIWQGTGRVPQQAHLVDDQQLHAEGQGTAAAFCALAAAISEVEEMQVGGGQTDLQSVSQSARQSVESAGQTASQSPNSALPRPSA